MGKWIKLSNSDIVHILDLIRMNEAEGTYINGRKRWQNHNNRLKKLFNQQEERQ